HRLLERLDDVESTTGRHDALDVALLVPRGDEEGRRIGAHPLVLHEAGRHPMRAVRVGALADEVGLVCVETLGALRYPLVHVPEGRLGGRAALVVAHIVSLRSWVVSRSENERGRAPVARAIRSRDGALAGAGRTSRGGAQA